MAQLVEQLIRNQQVAGPNPASSSKKNSSTFRLENFFIVFFRAEPPTRDERMGIRNQQDERALRKRHGMPFAASEMSKHIEIPCLRDRGRRFSARRPRPPDMIFLQPFGLEVFSCFFVIRNRRPEMQE